MKKIILTILFASTALFSNAQLTIEDIDKTTPPDTIKSTWSNALKFHTSESGNYGYLTATTTMDSSILIKMPKQFITLMNGKKAYIQIYEDGDIYIENKTYATDTSVYNAIKEVFLNQLYEKELLSEKIKRGIMSNAPNVVDNKDYSKLSKGELIDLIKEYRIQNQYLFQANMELIKY